ncbi:MAG: hypothetical protein ABIF17_01900 [Patescibacteria group bacterium]
MHLIKNKSGMTLLETVIALGILVVGIISVITLSQSSLVLSKASENNIIVTNLAREGIEIVRQTRDFSKSGNVSAVFANQNIRFFDTDTDPLTEVVTEGCYIVDAGNNFGLKVRAEGVNCSGNNFIVDDCTNCELYINSNTSMYSHDNSTGDLSSFKRVVKIVNSSSIEKKVLSKIFWAERGRSRQLMLEAYLYDW